jgi:hypothetical protein
MEITQSKSNLFHDLNSKSNRLDTFINYTSLFLFIAISSIPFFIGDEYLIIGFILSGLSFSIKRYAVDKFIIIYCLIFFTIFMLQVLFFSVFELNAIVGYFFRILYAYMTIKIIGNKIVDYYNNIIYFFSIIGLLFFIPTIFFKDEMETFLSQFSLIFEPFQLHNPNRTHVLIYTFGENYEDVDGDASKSWLRNSGPFWEPGGYGIFLIIAIIFELIKTKKLLTKRNIIFIICILTTLSTGSFLVLFALIVFYILTYPTKKRILFLGCFVFLSILIYNNTYFLVEKVETQTSNNKVSLQYTPRNRFVSGQLDMIDFMNNPILGRGRFNATRFDIKETGDLVINHRNNGTTNLLVEFGFFGFFSYFYFMYLSFKAYCEYNKFKPIFAFYATILILIMGFSQMIFIKPFFIGFSFLFLAISSKDIIYKK